MARAPCEYRKSIDGNHATRVDHLPTMHMLRAVTAVALALYAAPALAWHIAGTVYCDQNDSHTIDGPDTELFGYTAKVTSSGSTIYTDLTDGSGFYSIGLPDSPDSYTVTLTALPGGQTIRLPVGGS